MAQKKCTKSKKAKTSIDCRLFAQAEASLYKTIGLYDALEDRMIESRSKIIRKWKNQQLPLTGNGPIALRKVNLALDAIDRVLRELMGAETVRADAILAYIKDKK